MLKFVPVLASLSLIPVTVCAQTRRSPFVEAGVVAEYNSAPVSVDGLGGHLALGVFLSPTWHVAVTTDAVKNHYNNASWSNYSFIVGTTPVLTDKVALEFSAGFGAHRSSENGLHYRAPAATLGGGAAVAVSRHIAIAPQLRGFITFGREYLGATSIFELGLRWRR